MPAPIVLPDALITQTRDQVRAKWLRDYSLRNPTAKTGIGTDPYTDSAVFADGAMPIYANSITIAANVPRSTKTGAALDAEAIAMGQPVHRPAVGAIGAVVISASVGGTTIFLNDEFKINGLRYKCAATATYADQAQVPIEGIDTGPGTNVGPGTQGSWTNPRPGCVKDAKVALQADGSGLSDGADAETDADMQLRLAYAASNPPASGNDAEYQQAVLQTPGLSIGAVFTYPSILGPGTMGVAFTLRPASPGANRIPNAAQIAKVLAWLKGQFPADDVILVCTLVAQPIDVVFRETWAQGGTPGWADLVPWPIYNATKVVIDNGATPTATTFRLKNIDGTTIVAPQVGNTIAFYDAPNQVFRRKKVLTATFVAGTSYDIVCDQTNGASDTSYTPYSSGTGQPCCPWSDSLDALALPTVSYFDTLGPGEQRSTFFDPGLRERRSPRSPQFWPSEVSNRMLAPLFALAQVQDIALQEPTVPFNATVGTPGVSSNLITLRSITVFPT